MSMAAVKWNRESKTAQILDLRQVRSPHEMGFAGYVIWNSSVPRCCSCFYDVAGITLWPFVFVRDPEPSEADIEADTRAGGDLARRLRCFVRHERIHLAQATEMGVVPFYLLWVGDFACGMGLHACDARESYIHSRLEQEAFDHEEDEGYLESRACCAWTAYPREEIAEKIRQRYM